MRENKIKQQLNESIQRHKDEINRIENIRESREKKLRNHSRLLEDCKNDALGTVLKAIYIEALDPASLTDNGIILAESLVDSWIKSKGGASRIIALNRNKTYLLNRLCNIAEEAAFLEAEEIEGAEKEEENSENKTTSEEEKQNKVSELMAQAQELIAKATAIQNGEDVDEDPAEDTGDTDSVSADDMSSDDGESSEEAPAEDEGEESAEEAETEDSESEESDDDIDTDDDTTMDSDSDEDIDDVEDSEDDSEDDSDDSDDEDDLDDDGESDSDEDDDVDSVEDDNEDDLDNDGESDEDEDDDVDSVDDDDDMTMDSDSDEDIDDIEDQDVEDDGAEDGSDISDVEDEEPTTVNGEEQDGTPGAKGKIFDELEDEEDVKKAVQIISQRVADAEEDFVKRNAEDKKKIDDLIGKISDNIKTVEKISDNDDPKSKVAEESVRMYNRQIKNITENRPQKAFEKIVRKLSESALKDTVLKENYTLENGRLDIGGIIESAKVMYGFLEALNTLQLERVDKEYMANVIRDL